MQQNCKGDDVRGCRGETKIGGATGSSGPKDKSDQNHPAMSAQDENDRSERHRPFHLRGFPRISSSDDQQTHLRSNRKFVTLLKKTPNK